eukprot:NODE_1470_length_847_cov_12.781944_g1422_i0.p1 GENE.NODE_1470_length_847_cov_12.781944_g1422_i0~~NODE_1470_length_847_cov_12.781944_g1422_i0.p1  ORF type:complete len:108 (+),score=12.14 NODE_1470_length_847_cov_12.781944_g1422_i0:416-739(+)
MGFISPIMFAILPAFVIRLSHFRNSNFWVSLRSITHYNTCIEGVVLLSSLILIYNYWNTNVARIRIFVVTCLIILSVLQETDNYNTLGDSNDGAMCYETTLGQGFGL